MVLLENGGRHLRAIKNCVALAALLFLLAAPAVASAHEAYVLTPQEFHEGLSYEGFDAIQALKNRGNEKTVAEITIVVLIVLIINFLFRHSAAGRRGVALLQKWWKFGPLVVRVTMALSFFFSAASGSFLGPELALSSFPEAAYIRIALYCVSALILLGLFTEIAALAACAIYTIAVWKYGLYLMTYFNYIGEIAVLLMFGSRYFSLDGLLFGSSKRLQKLKKYETTIVRICYGIALCYAAITIKFLHSHLTFMVVDNYHLTKFTWLFPHDPLLVVLGAAFAELAIGIFIIVGFELRLTVLVSLFYITLSLLFFRELVWPHLLLYGISINLLLSPERFSLDGFFDRLLQKKHNPKATA